MVSHRIPDNGKAMMFPTIGPEIKDMHNVACY